MHLDGTGSASVDVVSGLPQGSVWEPIVGYAEDTTIYAVISRLLSRPLVRELLNQDLPSINSWCLKLHMRLNRKKTEVKGGKLFSVWWSHTWWCWAWWSRESAYFWGNLIVRPHDATVLHATLPSWRIYSIWRTWFCPDEGAVVMAATLFPCGSQCLFVRGRERLAWWQKSRKILY